MSTLSNLCLELFPIIGAVLLISGIKMARINYLVAALWLSLISLIFHYQTAGNEILGTYFGYKHAAVYTLNLLVLISSLLCLFFKLPLFQGKITRYITGFMAACLIIASLLLLTNLWINACFIEKRHPGSPIMQIATFTPLEYCTHRYVFYKVGLDNRIAYMCPNHYGVIPSIGYLDVSSEFLLNELTGHGKQQEEENNKDNHERINSHKK